MFLAVKIIVTAIIVVIISEISRRYTLAASLLASLPLTSILAFIWIYYESGDVEKISQMSHEIFWLVIPSLLFFIILPFLLKTGMKFYLALGGASLIMAVIYISGIFLYKIIK